MTATARRPKKVPRKSSSGRNKKIAFFNNKGGVSKTTTTFNLGWMLATKGHRVVLVNADPQCNLSGLVLGYKGPKEFETFYEKQPERNIRAGLTPAFESQPKVIEAIECVPVEGNPNLFLLPGHIGLSEYEVGLGMAQQLSAPIPTLQNLPGSLSYLMEKTGKRYDAEYVLIDMNPSLSSINQNLVMTSDFFLVPASPDYFSVMAINSLTRVLPRWRAWSRAASSMQVFRDASILFRRRCRSSLVRSSKSTRLGEREGRKQGQHDGRMCDRTEDGKTRPAEIAFKKRAYGGVSRSGLRKSISQSSVNLSRC